MGFQASIQIHRARINAASIAPYYGLSTDTNITEALVLGLAHRGTAGTNSFVFTMDATPGSGLFMFYAYPVDFGASQFLDSDSGFPGGWDGAQNDIWDPQKWGPVTITVMGIPFYVYRTDYEDLGLKTWTVSDAT